MYPKNPLFQKCLAYLESLPNMQATIQAEPYFSSEVLADGQLVINAADKTIHYVCEIKTGLTTDVIEQVAEYFTNLAGRLKDGQRPLLITSDLSDRVVEKLIEKNIEFIDIDGNVYLNHSGIYIIARKQIFKGNANQSLEITAAMLQVMYVFLVKPSMLSVHPDRSLGLLRNEFSPTPSAASMYLEPKWENYVHQDTALASNLSLKTVVNTLRKLQELGYLAHKSKSRHRRMSGIHDIAAFDRILGLRKFIYEIIDYVRFLERWELGYAERLRAKLLIDTYSPAGGKQLSEMRDEIQSNADEYGYLIGGELAASIMLQHLRPSSTTLHLQKHDNARRIAVQLRLKPDPDGSITLLQCFGDTQYQRIEQNLAHPLLVHAELVRTGNSRLKETAQLIYDRYLEPIAQSHDRSQ
jgi:hypothetical protein